MLTCAQQKPQNMFFRNSYLKFSLPNIKHMYGRDQNFLRNTKREEISMPLAI